jgi:hypothetical protein
VISALQKAPKFNSTNRSPKNTYNIDIQLIMERLKQQKYINNHRSLDSRYYYH